jgi:hypothetical protein
MLMDPADPELRETPSGKVIVATAFLAGYREELKGVGQGYKISAETVAVEPGAKGPDVLTLTLHGIITIPQ